jgi:thymidylate synthase (FAD)
MEVSLVDFMGSDLTVVNAARVSFNKQSEMMMERDDRLIAYLAKHGHWTPFAHPQLQFRVSAPIFVARQLGKHQVGLVWNEVSRRYVNYEPKFYAPIEWREKANPNKSKQGSGKDYIALPTTDRETLRALQDNALELYGRLIKRGVAPEQARMILPQSMYTEWYWTGSLYAFSRVYNLRVAEDAQHETRLIVEMIGEEIEKHFPQSWKCLIGKETGKSEEHADNQSNENEPTDGTVSTTTT